MLNDDKIVTSVQAESYPDNDETDEDEDNNNESSKGPSNAGAFSALETAIITMAIGDGSRNFEPRSSYEDDTSIRLRVTVALWS
ncbi:hypothetical protein TNCV_129601 [Trichonephila clavipes]|nr:hypothetical protein TNCV_129601 [Trichonephila clavipes]